MSGKREGDGCHGTECAVTERGEIEGGGGGRGRQRVGGSAYLVTAPSARSGLTIAKSGGDRDWEKMRDHGRPYIAGGGCLSTVCNSSIGRTNGLSSGGPT